MNIFGFALLWLALSSGASFGNPSPERRALTRVHVVEVGTGKVSDLQTILIDAGRITSIQAETAPVPPGYFSLDGHAGYAIPGLWDAHVHLTDASLSDAIAMAPAFLRAGVTSVRDMGGNLPVLDTMRVMESQGLFHGPHIMRSGPFVDSAKDGAPDRIAVETVAQAKAAVETLQGEGVDFIKVHNGVSKEVFQAVMASANDRQLKVAVHLPRSITVEEATDSGVATIEHTETLLESGLRSLHLPGKSVEEGTQALRLALRTDGDSLIAHMKRHGTCFTPTLSEYRSFSGLTASGYPVDSPRVAPPTLVAFWDKYFVPEPGDLPKNAIRQTIFGQFPSIVSAMSGAGIPILAGTDLGARDIYPGYSLHEELSLLSKAGLSNREVLASATVNPPACMGWSKDYGDLASGKVADIVVLDSNPLIDIKVLGHPRMVVANGTPVPLSAGRSQLEDTAK